MTSDCKSDGTNIKPFYKAECGNYAVDIKHDAIIVASDL